MQKRCFRENYNNYRRSISKRSLCFEAPNAIKNKTLFFLVLSIVSKWLSKNALLALEEQLLILLNFATNMFHKMFCWIIWKCSIFFRNEYVNKEVLLKLFDSFPVKHPGFSTFAISNPDSLLARFYSGKYCYY